MNIQLPPPPIQGTVRFGFIVLGAFLVVLLGWGTLTHLDAAAVAPGEIMVQSYRKTIQHLEGGIIQKLYVTEGTQVKKDEPLIQLEPTRATVSYQLLKFQTNAYLAEILRLSAQRDNKDSIEWPARILESKDDPRVAKIISDETNQLHTNIKQLSDQIAILNERINQIKNEILSIKAQQESGQSQLSYIQREIKAMQYLDKQDLIDKPRLYSLQREEARLQGDIEDKTASIARAEQRISETQQQIIATESTALKQTLSDLAEAKQRYMDASEKEQSAKDVLDRTLITAPATGQVLGLTKHTVGGVVGPGETIMQIIPKNDSLVIEAKISPLDIDVVKIGMPAKIRFSSLKARTTPVYDGIVADVSADNYTNDKTGQIFYKAIVKINPRDAQKVAAEISPGMPVEVMVVSESRTPLNYLIKPLLDSFEKAFKEE